MTCDDVKFATPEYLSRDMPRDQLHQFEDHLEHCATCRLEVNELSALWRSMARIPQVEPSPMMRTRFEDMLAAYEQGVSRGLEQRRWWPRFKVHVRQFWPAQPVWQAAVALGCLVVGFAAGSIAPLSTGSKAEITNLRGEIASMRQLVTLSLLQQQSPSDRLKGVNWSFRLEQPTPEVPTALVYAVSHDENVNVRLAAVDALHNFATDDRIRRSLLNGLSKQESPLVQIALIDLLAQMHEPELARSLQGLVADSRANAEVRQRAQIILGKMRIQ